MAGARLGIDLGGTFIDLVLEDERGRLSTEKVPPAPVGGRAFMNQRIVELVFGALAQAIPDRVNAGSGQWTNPIFGGVDPETGERFVFYDYTVGGVGARRERDGVDALPSCVSVENMPLELQEATSPVLIERMELIPDSGGAGRTRGGLAIRKDVRVLHGGVLTSLTDRQRTRPYGLEGGHDGSLGATLLNPGQPGERPLESKGVYELEAGSVLSFRCSGSGGFGPPSERPRDAVRHDLHEGYISERASREIYGLDEAPDSPTGRA